MRITFKERQKMRVKALIMCAVLMASSAAYALPTLQLYVEGGTYDTTTDTWVVAGGDSFRLWAIGNVDGPGGKGPILDVHLAVAYSSSESPTITLTPSTTGGYGGFTDPSLATAATLTKTVTDGSIPTLSDGSDLPSHGIYGVGTHWQEFALGDFTLTDSPVADFIGTFPTPGSVAGQINVYEVSVTGSDVVHFDLYNSVQAGNKIRALFAPLSHDGEGGGTVPEPATAVMLGLGLAAIAAKRSRKEK